MSTVNGQTLVQDIAPDDDSSPRNLTVIGNNLYFSAFDDAHGSELWRYDGRHGFELWKIESSVSRVHN